MRMTESVMSNFFFKKTKNLPPLCLPALCFLRPEVIMLCSIKVFDL